MDSLAPLSLFRAGLSRIVGFALPPRCPGCGVVVGADHSFCLDCWRQLDFLGGPACACCGVPLELALHPDTRCGTCLADPPIARALALKLKHGGRIGTAVTMARLMARAIGPIAADTLVVPVPLHRGRLWRRGYNQSALIARALVRQAGGTLCVDLLRRTKATPLLRGLGRGARARAVAGAFGLSPAAKARVKGASILLVDDVFTTGATARACARALARAGAAEIVVACWARVLADRDEPADVTAR
jgi:ComF family protein